MKATILKRYGLDIEVLLKIASDSIRNLEGEERLWDKAFYYRSYKNPHTDIFVKHSLVMFMVCENEADAVYKQTKALLSTKTLGKPSFWQLQFLVFYGWSLASRGKVEEGLKKMQKGIVALEKQGIVLAMPLYYFLYAEILIAVNRPGKADSSLETAMNIIRQTGERWFESEYYRLKGVVSLKSDRPGAKEEAEAWFQKGLNITGRSGNRLFEQRIRSTKERLFA